MWNVHRMFILIYIEHRNPKTRNSRNWFRYETFIHLFVFKGFSTWGERDTLFLCWLLLHRLLSTQPTRGARSAQSRLASPSSESQPFFSEAGTQLTAFSQISAHASGAWRHPNTLFLIPICDFYFDISEWHILSACAWTPALILHLTNPCAKRKVLILTKPKGKIYKTKSLHNYITYIYIYREREFDKLIFVVRVVDMNRLRQNRRIGRMSRVFANGPEDLGSIPGRVILKSLKMVLDTALLNT